MSQNSSPTVCLTFDFDAISVWLGSFGADTPTPMSRGEFGARVGVPRILRLLAREQITATFYIPGHTVDSFPEVCAEIRDSGHEIGHHRRRHVPVAGALVSRRAAGLEHVVPPDWGDRGGHVKRFEAAHTRPWPVPAAAFPHAP